MGKANYILRKCDEIAYSDLRLAEACFQSERLLSKEAKERINKVWGDLRSGDYALPNLHGVKTLSIDNFEWLCYKGKMLLAVEAHQFAPKLTRTYLLQIQQIARYMEETGGREKLFRHFHMEECFRDFLLDLPTENKILFTYLHNPKVTDDYGNPIYTKLYSGFHTLDELRKYPEYKDYGQRFSSDDLCCTWMSVGRGTERDAPDKELVALSHCIQYLLNSKGVEYHYLCHVK